MVEHGKYSIDKKGDRVIISCKGFADKNNVSDFLRDYENLKKSVNVHETTLIVDGTDLKVFPKEVESDLAKLYADYAKFKKLYVIMSKDVVSKLQLQRVLKGANLMEKVKFINSVDEAE